MRKAKWIWIDNLQSPDRYVDFFDSVFYGGGNAELKISCDSNYALYINGTLAAFGQYADYPHYKIYDKIDITAYLRNGKNEIKIIVWYYGETTQTYYKACPGLIYEITSGETVLCFSGAHTLCCEDGNYISGRKKLITNQLGFSFIYDTAKKDIKLQNSVLTDFEGGLFSRPVKKLELTKTFFGKLIDKKKNLYDLGAERAGFLHIKFKAGNGAVLNVSYGEHISDGEVRRLVGGRDFSVQIIGNGEKTEYLSPFRRLGGRYLQIGCPDSFEIEFIGIKETLYPLEFVDFNSGNPLRQKIYDTAVRTLHLCMHEHYEDTPWREQALYTLDSRNQMLCGYYAFNEFEFAKANLRLILNDRRDDKLLSICFPSSSELTIPSYSLYYILQVKEYLERSGDKVFAGQAYKRLAEIASVFILRMEDGLVGNFHGSENHWNFYEWADGLCGKLFEKDEKRFDLILNCLFSHALSALSYIARALDEIGDADSFAKQASDINKSVKEKFFSKSAGLFETFENSGHYSELGNALAVICGAADEALAGRICKTLSSENSLIKATLSMACFKYDALLKTDPEKYKDFVLKGIDSVYGFMLERGATSFWETIEGERDFDGAGSLCHGWSAMPVYYYHKLIK